MRIDGYSLDPIGDGSLDDFLLQGYRYGSLNKVLLCSPPLAAAFSDRSSFGVRALGDRLPIPIVRDDLPRNVAILIDRDYYEAMNARA